FLRNDLICNVRVMKRPAGLQDLNCSFSPVEILRRHVTSHLMISECPLKERSAHGADLWSSSKQKGAPNQGRSQALVTGQQNSTRPTLPFGSAGPSCCLC